MGPRGQPRKVIVTYDSMQPFERAEAAASAKSANRTALSAQVLAKDRFPPTETPAHWLQSMAAMGHEERFPPPRLNGWCRIRKRPVAADD
jgi:hypothetical protein